MSSPSHPVTQPGRSPAEVAPGVWAVGGTVPLDGRISWFAPTARGHAGLYAYALVDGERAVLVDTGLPVHEAEILAQLEQVLAGVRDVTLILTRIVEFDSVGNAAAIVRAFPVTKIHAHFEPASWISRGGAAVADVEYELFAGPETVAGGRELELVNAPLRLLNTRWVYDRATGVLFTSDSFGQGVLASPNDAWVADDEEAIDPGAVREHLFAKFDWLLAARTDELSAQLAAIFVDRDVRALAPAHGRILRGRELVRRELELVQDALASVRPAEARA